MDIELRPRVEGLLTQFLREDEHYLASSAIYGDCDGQGVGRALQLFLDRPELGFVWVGTREREAVTACVVCFARSTSTGTLVAKLDDVFVAPGSRGSGIGTELLTSLASELRGLDVTRIDGWVWDLDDELFHKLDAFEKEAEEMGLSMTQYAVRWALNQPAVVSSIVGVKRSDQIGYAVAAAETR